jgi:hypothetical protein
MLLNAWPACGAREFAASLTPASLRCHFSAAPLGIDEPQPRLFWTLDSPQRAQHQTAFQILAATSREQLDADRADLWDSGKTLSAETAHVRYAGRPLASSQQIFWKVRCWDQDDRVSRWSQPASWTMGLLHSNDWQGSWIGLPDTNAPSLLLRHEFVARPGLSRALIHVCGLGQYELTLNGKKAGRDILSPGWTRYNRTCLYDTRDLTSLVRNGTNAIGLFLGNGMYRVTGGRYAKFKGSFGPLQAIALIQLEYRDGATNTLFTDPQWQAAPGPITFSCMFGGEDFDARLFPKGWDIPGFDASHWSSAAPLPGPGGQLRGFCAAAPAISTFEVFKPAGVAPVFQSAAREENPDQSPASASSNSPSQLTNRPEIAISVYDFAQNASIMPQLKAHGPAGSSIRIRPGELLLTNGLISRFTCGKRGEAYWTYTLSGQGQETWFPKFFYHGSRYLQVERLPAPGGQTLPIVDKLEAVAIRSTSPAAGDFSCSSDLFNRTRKLVLWAQRNNFMSILTDCPHRERLGWLEQYHLNGPALRYEFDPAQLYTKCMGDMADSQLENGLVPNIAPEYTVFKEGFRDSPEWGSACVLVPWQQYLWSGDLDLLRRSYPTMQRYQAHLQSLADTNHIVSQGLGDWFDLGPNKPWTAQLTPIPLTATAFYYYDTLLLSRIAEILSTPSQPAGVAQTFLSALRDATNYAAQAAQIRASFNQAFFNPTTRQYAAGSQTGNAIPLVMGLAETSNRTDVLRAIVADVRQRTNSLTSGDIGYRYLLRALAEGGRSDVIFDMNHQSERPGYGYQLKLGATSLTESWDARPTTSQDHFMLGQITEWFYHDLAGIQPDASGPGFSKIILKPQPVGNLTSASATYRSIRGPITSEWKRNDAKFQLHVRIPANTTATVWVPCAGNSAVLEGGKPAETSPGIRFLRREAGAALYEIGSGSYTFTSRLTSSSLSARRPPRP